MLLQQWNLPLKISISLNCCELGGIKIWSKLLLRIFPDTMEFESFANVHCMDIVEYSLFTRHLRDIGL